MMSATDSGDDDEIGNPVVQIDEEPVVEMGDKKSKLESLEIELGESAEEDSGNDQSNGNRIVSVQSEDDEEMDEAVGLLDKSETNKTDEDEDDEEEYSCLMRCCAPELKMGNICVPSLYVYGYTGGWGAIGPHFLGPPCILCLWGWATYYFAVECSLKRHWYLTAGMCGLLALSTLYFFISAAYRDPGVVREGRLNLPDPVPRSYRWCSACNYYQPPTTMHCPDCDACVAGFDHHCVWMGTCVGVANFKPFMRFNLSWIAYLLYAIFWVSVIAPLIEKHH